MSAEARAPKGTGSVVSERGSSDPQITALERLVGALEAKGSEVQGYENPPTTERFLAQCPAHNDGNPSLVVFERTDGTVNVYCRARCETREVVKALGLTMGDLFSMTYRYEDGRVVHRQYNADGRKTFRQANGKGGGVLYRISEVEEAREAGADVHLCEGERDAETLRGLGRVATTAPGGAGGIAWVDLAPLEGARVVAHADHDGAGEKWAATVRERLDGYAASLEFMRPKVGKDVTDHIEAGHTLAELVLSAPTRHPRTQAVLDAALDASELDGLPEPTPLLTGALNASEYVLLSGNGERAAGGVAADRAEG